MEPVLKLDQHSEVELQGWLLKRGAGYADAGDEIEVTKAKFPKIPLDSLFFGRTDKSRYFVLVKSERKSDDNPEPAAFIYYYAKTPKIIKDKAHGEVKDIRDKHTRRTELQIAGKIVQTPVNAMQMRGTIELTDSTQVILKDGVIKLICPGRTYFLRSPEDKKTEAEMTFLVGQWYEGIRKLITWLQGFKIRQSAVNTDHLKRLSTAYHRASVRMMQPAIMARKSSLSSGNDDVPRSLSDILAEPFYRKEFKDFLSYSHATENLEFYDKVVEYKTQGDRLLQVSSLKSIQKDIEAFAKSIYAEYVAENAPKQVNLSSDQRRKIMDKVKSGKSINTDIFNEAQREVFLLMETNFFQRFYRDLLKRTGCFASLFHQCGLSGYEAIVQNHFGSVMTESERLLVLLKGKMEMIEKQTEIIHESLKFSHEIAVQDFKTLKRSLNSVYKSSFLRLSALDQFQRELRENCINKLEGLINTLSTVLNELLKEDNKRIDAWKSLADNYKYLGDIKRSLEMHSRMVQQNAETIEKANEDLAKYKLKLTVDGFPDAIEKAKRDAEDAEREERSEWRELSEDLSMSLNNLEKLDLHRLTEQQIVMQSFLVAEGDYYQMLMEDVERSHDRILDFNIDEDVGSFARTLNARLTESIFGATA